MSALAARDSSYTATVIVPFPVQSWTRGRRIVNMVPWLSIWFLARNGSSYLTDSIEAVLDQGYKDSELLISDYCPSTDSTPGPTNAAKDATHGFAMSTSQRNADLVQDHAFVIGNVEVNS